MNIDIENIGLIVLAFAMGGVIKGATGAGAPIIAVPLLALFYDVPFAIAVFAVPNIVTNLIQGWRYRTYRLPRRFFVALCIGGAAGCVLGTLLLTSLSSDALMSVVALVVFVYVGFRFLRPDWKLEFDLANKIVFPVAMIAGILQGASGISAPVSITFLNSMRLTRPQFIITISMFFLAVGFAQIPLLVGFGIINLERIYYGCLAVLPLMAFMPVGSFLVSYISKENFDKIILVLLLVLAVKLVVDVLK